MIIIVELFLVIKRVYALLTFQNNTRLIQNYTNKKLQPTTIGQNKSKHATST